MRALLIVLALTPFQASQPVQPPARSWRQLLVVAGDGVNVEHLESLTRRREITWRDESNVAPGELASGSVVIVGTKTSNRFVREFAPDEFADWYDRPGHVVQIVRRNPLNPDYRMVLVVGAIDAPLGRRRADVHIRHHGKTVLLGFEEDDGTFETRRFEPIAAPQLVADGFRFFVHGFDIADNDALRALIVSGQQADVHVYPSLEDKGLITDNTRSAHVENGVFHVVLDVDERPVRFIAENLMEGDAPVFEKRGRAAVRVFDAKTLDQFDDVARRLLRTSDPPSLVEFLDDEVFNAESPFVSDAVSASFARFVADRAFDVVALEDDWSRALAKLSPSKSAGVSLAGSFQRGVTYAHMGYQIHNGYLSGRSESSLSKLKSMGSDAVALVPYTFVQDPKLVEPLEVPTRAGSETDEDVIHAIRRAQAQSMIVMLKPQIWVRRGWPGDIEPSSPEQAALFFREYRRWIRHYALMAEANDVALLAIGTEMAKLSRGYRAQWATIIEDIRCVYRGKLVYAANWGSEVENVDFWDLLDYIGVDFYYPLSFEEVATDDALLEGFEAALDRLRKLHELHDKPVLLTETGYASTKSPWTKPHASDKFEEFSADDQSRAYEIAFTALADETEWIRGMYWWKWPTNLERGGPDHRGFTPNGKPAQDVLRRWYDGRLQ